MMTSSEFADVVDLMENYWELSRPWKARVADLYQDFAGFTKGAMLEAVRLYGNGERADYCPSPKKLIKLTNDIHQKRIREGIDPNESPARCSDRGHTWALASPVDLDLAAAGGNLATLNEDVCVVCRMTRHHQPERTSR